MQEKNQTKRIMQLTIVGGLFLFILYRSYHADNIFAVFFYSILGILEIFLLSNIIPEDFTDFKKNRKIQTLIPTFLAFIIIFLNLGIYLYYENLQNSKTYLLASGNGLNIDLKEDGKYIITTGSWGGRIHHYGNYKRKDSILYLDKNNFGNIKISGEFKLGKIYIDKEKSTKNVLFETEKNKIIEHTNYFYVLETK